MSLAAGTRGAVRFLIGLPLCLFAALGWAQFPGSPEVFQRDFEVAIRTVQQGNARAGAELLSALYARTRSVRVKLEWARALYLSGQFDAARVLFTEVLRGEIPEGVRDNVRRFMADIEQRTVKVDFSVSLIRDSNPGNVTYAREFLFAGVPVTFEPAADARQSTGLNAVMGVSGALGSPALRGLARLTLVDFPGRANDRAIINAGVSVRLPSLESISIGAELEHFSFGAARLYDSAWLSAAWVTSPVSSTQFGLGAKVGQVDYPIYAHMSGPFQQLSAQASEHFPSLRTRGALDLKLERQQAEDPASAFSARSVGVSATTDFPALALSTTIGVAMTRRKYAAADIFFGGIRDDRLRVVSLSVSSRKLRWGDYEPALELRSEVNDSSLDFYKYRKTTASLSVRKIF